MATKLEVSLREARTAFTALNDNRIISRFLIQESTTTWRLKDSGDEESMVELKNDINEQLISFGIEESEFEFVNN